MKKNIWLVICLLILFLPFFSLSANNEIVAEQTTTQFYHINIDKATINKGYTVTAFKDSLKLSLVPGILASATPVDLILLREALPMPWRLDRLSSVYQFEFRNKQAYDNHHPFYIQMSYEEASNAHKQVFFYDKNFATWRPLPTQDFPKEKFVRSLIHLPYARIAVFAFPDTLTKGQASWYAYKHGLFAASPDYPKGSRLRVHNLDNGKFVDVVVNDYGPDRALHPTRPIDLDKVAFARIANLSDGVVDVLVEPLQIAPDNQNLTMAIPEHGIGEKPYANVRSAVVIDANSGKQIFAKAATTTLPLASLTKLMAVYIFLQIDNDLDRVVKYSQHDAELNYAYCRPWESAKLNIADGEELTIKDLIYSSLVGSANNTIETLVRVSGVDRLSFIKKMNDMAFSWGASSTHFVEPTGLSPENITSADDYALLATHILQNTTISQASITVEYKFTTLGNKINKRIRNTDKIIKNGRFNITGSKTGYLDEALYCLMTRVKTSEGQSIIVVTMGAPSRTMSFIETEKLIQYGLRKHANKI